LQNQNASLASCEFDDITVSGQTYNLNNNTTYGTYTGTLNSSLPTSSDCFPLANPALIAPPCTVVSEDSEGNIWGAAAYQYNSSGGMTASNAIDVPDGKNYLTTYTYTTQGNVNTIAEPNGQTITYNWTLCNDLIPSSISDTIVGWEFTANCDSSEEFMGEFRLR
jgi:hypothetical protein